MAESQHGIRIASKNGEIYRLPSFEEVQAGLNKRQKIPYGWSSTAATESGKEASIDGVTLVDGSIIAVTFTNGNSVAAPALSVNGETARTIQIRNGSLTADMIPANYRALLQYGSRTSGSPTVYWTLLNPASAGGGVDWDGITNKPAIPAPANIATTALDTTVVQGTASTFARSDHKHAIPAIPTSLPPSGNAGGDLTGTYPNPTLAAVSRTNNTSTASPAAGGAFTAIDTVTTDTNGRVTAVNTKTVTLPAAGGGGGLVTGTFNNWDTTRTTGLYYSSTGSPSGTGPSGIGTTSGSCSLYVFAAGNDCIVQIAGYKSTTNASSRMWMRSSASGSAWGPWKEVSEGSGGVSVADLGSQGTAAFGQAAANGSAATAARSDHRHALPAAPSVPAAANLSSQAAEFGQAARNGTAATFARSDHYHALPSASTSAPTLTSLITTQNVGAGGSVSSPTVVTVNANTSNINITPTANNQVYAFYSTGTSRIPAAIRNSTSYTNIQLYSAENSSASTKNLIGIMDNGGGGLLFGAYSLFISSYNSRMASCIAQPLTIRFVTQGWAANSNVGSDNSALTIWGHKNESIKLATIFGYITGRNDSGNAVLNIGLNALVQPYFPVVSNNKNLAYYAGSNITVNGTYGYVSTGDNRMTICAPQDVNVFANVSNAWYFFNFSFYYN